jgi:hypothetical protein
MLITTVNLYLHSTLLANSGTCDATQVRGHRLDDGVEIVALKPCALTIAEGR